jgi:hypothetical protein
LAGTGKAPPKIVVSIELDRLTSHLARIIGDQEILLG